MTKEQFNHKQWRGYSMATQWVAFLLKNIFLDIQLGRGNTMSLLGNATSVDGNTPTGTIKLGCSILLPVILAHTLELILKGLLGRTKKDHNLIKLYNLLDQETKEMLKYEFSRELKNTNTVHRDLEDVLTEHQEDFKKWRYPDELPSVTSKTGLESWEYMQFAICSALDVYDQKYSHTGNHQR